MGGFIIRGRGLGPFKNSEELPCTRHVRASTCLVQRDPDPRSPEAVCGVQGFGVYGLGFRGRSLAFRVTVFGLGRLVGLIGRVRATS